MTTQHHHRHHQQQQQQTKHRHKFYEKKLLHTTKETAGAPAGPTGTSGRGGPETHLPPLVVPAAARRRAGLRPAVARGRRVCPFRLGPSSLFSLLAVYVISVALSVFFLRLYRTLVVVQHPQHQQQEDTTTSNSAGTTMMRLVMLAGPATHHDTTTGNSNNATGNDISNIIKSSSLFKNKKDAIAGPTTTTTNSTAEAQGRRQREGEEEYDHDDVTTTNISMAILDQDNHKEDKKMKKKLTPAIIAALNNNKNESIAACLLTMDDNHFLIEWLAYHYHVLPLRHLIVAVDPRAKTSPQEIFDRWIGLINITVWNDTHIFAGDEEEEENNLKKNHAENIEKGNKLMRLHRKRQLTLYEKCMRQFKSDAGHQWVMLLDTDEFLVVHANHHEDIRWPGSVLKYLNEQEVSNQQQQQDGINEFHYYNTTTNANMTTSISHANTTRTPACLPLPRRRYGTKESKLRYQDKYVPKGYNSSDFLTMRWRHYGMRDRNVLIKTMIDVSRVDWDDLHTDPAKRNGVHVPLDICGDKIRMSLSESKLIVSHYAGTWEQFSFRDDARKGSKAEDMISKEAYHKLKRFQVYHDDLLRDWLIGFIKSVGNKEAHRLLKDVGKVIV